MQKRFFVRKKGFTLIELLAVIVILAIILLIVMPIVLNVINDARRGAFEATARGLNKTAENQYMENRLRGNPLEVDYVFADWEQTEGDPLKFSGRGPKDGIVRVYDNGDTEMAINDDNWCVTKDRDETDINPAVPYDGDCLLPSEDVANGGNGGGNGGNGIGNGGNGDDSGKIDEDEGYEVDEYDEDEEDCLINGECEGVDLPDYYVGTEGTWIPVANEVELDNVRYEENNTFGAGTPWQGTYLGGLDKNYIQVMNIDLDTIANWTPINHFQGRYDGAGFSISNLTVSADGSMGLFSWAQQVEFRNIIIIDATLTRTGDAAFSVTAGALVADLEESTVENCVAINTVIEDPFSDWAYHGGLIGFMYAYSSPQKINNSHAINPQITGTNEEAGMSLVFGGLIGQLDGDDNVTEVINSSARNVNLVKANGGPTGGLIAISFADKITVTGSYATGTINSGGYGNGGLIGSLNPAYFDLESMIVSNSYAQVEVTGGDSYIASFIGFLEMWPEWGGHIALIQNNYAAGPVIEDFNPNDYQSWWHDYTKGFIGEYSGDGSPVENSYFDIQVTGYDGAGDNPDHYGIPRSTSDMTYPHNDSNTYVGWDFAEVWAIDPCVNKGYPYLQWQTFSTAHLDLCILGSNSPVTEGETLTVQTHVYNHTGSSVDKSVSLTIEGSEKDSTVVNIPANSSVTVDLNWETEVGDAGEKEAVVNANGSEAMIMVEILPVTPEYDCPALAKNIGDAHDGGLIAYCDGTSGLLATTAENSASEVWGIFAEPNLDTTSKAYGSGYDNTQIIVNEWPGTATAADVCWDLSSGGHSDWFLPSKDELVHFYNNHEAIGGFETTENPFYWSSSEYDEDPEYSSGWLQSFSSGSQYYANKGHEYRVRCARYFE